MPSMYDGANRHPPASPPAEGPQPTGPPLRLSRILWGTALPARPTLRGLIIVPKADEPVTGPSEFFPWQRVHTFGNYGFWSVLDEDGRPLKRNGRPLCLQVKGWHTKRVARRLQKRHLQQAWDNGTLSVTADLSGDLPSRWPVVVIALFFIAVLTMMFWSIWRTPARPPFWQADSPVSAWFDKRLLMWFFWVICVLAAGLFCGALWRSVSKINTTWIRLQRTGVTATLKDGSTVLQPWDSLTSIGSSFTSLLLKFGTGTVLRLEPGRLAGIRHPVIHIIRQNILKEPAADEGELTRPQIIRIGLYCLVACFVGSLLIGLMPPETRRVNVIEAFLLLLFGFGVLWGMLAAAVFMPPLVAKTFSRWRRRWRRGGLKASSCGR